MNTYYTCLYTVIHTGTFQYRQIPINLYNTYSMYNTYKYLTLASGAVSHGDGQWAATVGLRFNCARLSFGTVQAQASATCGRSA